MDTNSTEAGTTAYLFDPMTARMVSQYDSDYAALYRWLTSSAPPALWYRWPADADGTITWSHDPRPVIATQG